MKKHLISFSSMADFNEFINQIDFHHYQVNRRQLTVTGPFSERELELAINGFAASVEPYSL